MAGVYKLKLKFKDADGNTIQFTYPYVDPNLSSHDAEALMDVMIAKGRIFEKVPKEAISASIVYSEETPCGQSSSSEVD